MRMENKILWRSLRSITIVAVLFLSLLCITSSIPVKAYEPTQVLVTPESQTVSADNTFTVSIMCIPGQPIKSFELRITFNPSLIQANSVSEGDIFQGYMTFFNSGTINNAAGTIINIYNLIIGSENISTQGTLVTISFTAKTRSGTSGITLSDVGVTNEIGYVTLSLTSGQATVQGQSGDGGDGYTPPQGGEEPPIDENTAPQTPGQPLGPANITQGILYSYASSSFGSDNDTIRFLFDWGDGSISNWTVFVIGNTSVTSSHRWSNNSTFSIRVLAQDEHGLNSSWSSALLITVSETNENESIPIPKIIAPENITANASIVFDASGSYDPEGSIVSYSWDFDDGAVGTGVNPEHSYTLPGVYHVVLTLTDNLGNVYQKTFIINVLGSSKSVSGNSANFPIFYLIGLVFAIVIASIIVLLLKRSRQQPITMTFYNKALEARQRNPQVFMVQQRRKKLPQKTVEQKVDEVILSKIERQIDTMK